MQRELKICVVSDHFSSGPGGQHRIQNLSRGFEYLGHKVLYVSPYGASEKISDLYIDKTFSKYSVQEYVSPYFSDFFKIFKTISTLRIKFDFLLIGLPNTMMKSLNAFYGMVKDIPVAFDFGGLHASLLDKGKVYGDIRISIKIFRLFAQVYEDFLALSSSKLPDIITVPTTGMKNIFEKFLKRPVYVIPHPVDTVNFFNPDKYVSGRLLNILPPQLKDKQFIMLGIKDDPRFVTIVEEVIFNHKLQDIVFIVMGNMNKFRSAIIKKGLDKFIFFTGSRPNIEVPLYISFTKFAVALSVPEIAHVYYFPDNISKISEYFSMGKPTITNSLGASDYVQNGVNGFICGSFEDVVKKIVLLIDKPELAIQMGKHAREFACEKLDFRLVASKYLEYLEN